MSKKAVLPADFSILKGTVVSEGGNVTVVADATISG
jgi:hypothetical protein